VISALSPTPSHQGTTPQVFIEHWKEGRFWAVRDEAKQLVCICVYLKGTIVIERITGVRPAPHRARNASP
jgi:hypothetical protein